ncbi:MAG: methyltransferase domain-containing protein [Pseudomonadota bacterium]
MTSSRDTYTHGHHQSVLDSHRWRNAENSAAYLLAHLTDVARLLDVGCGPATLTADLARLIDPGVVTAIEPQQSVVDIAHQGLQDAGAANVQVELGDVYNLGYANETFEVVHAHQVLQHLSAPLDALKEMRRVCKSNGVVAIRDADYGTIRFWPEMPELVRWLALYFQVAESNDAYPDAGRRLQHWANDAGFSKVAPSASVWCFATAENRAWWGGTWSQRILSSSVATQALERGFADREELQWISDGWQTWVADPNAWFNIVHGEILATP